MSEIMVVNVDLRRFKRVRVYPLGDVHIGAASHDREAWTRWLQYLSGRKSNRMLGTGDFLNCAITGSRSDIYEEQQTVQEGREQLEQDLRPLKNQIDAIIPGNHEARVYRATGDCPVKVVASALGVSYNQNAVLVKYHVGTQVYKIYMRHGSTGGATIGALANGLVRQVGIVDADVYVSGHSHTQLAFPKQIFIEQDGRVIRKDRYFVSSGSFLNYEGYAQAAGYAPVKIGAPRIYLDGREHDIHVSI